MRPLAWALPILTFPDTTTLAGEFLKAIFCHLSLEDRERVEHAILMIPDALNEEHRHSSERIRDRLLGCLQYQSLVTQKAIAIFDSILLGDGPPENDPSSEGIKFTSRPFGEKEFLANLGVPVDTEVSRKIRLLEEPIKEFSKKYQNSFPAESSVLDVLPNLKELYEFLKADAESVHIQQQHYAWGCLAEACECVSKLKTLSCGTNIGSFTKQVLLEISNYAEPEYHPENDEHFDNSPSWGSPAARIDAAQGLMQIAQYNSCIDTDILTAISRLSFDAVPAVRYQVARRILSLYKTASNLMWHIIEDMSHKESSRGVLQGLLPSLWRLGDIHGERVAELSKAVFDRVTDGSGVEQVREHCTSIFTRLYLWQDLKIANETINTIAAYPDSWHKEVRCIIGDLRECFIIGSINSPDLLEEQVRSRAFEVTQKILSSIIKILKTLETNYKQVQFSQWPLAEQERAQNLIQIADSIATELYFASGAFDDKRNSAKDSAASLGLSGKKRFLTEAYSILSDLSNLGFTSITHHLLETLIFLVDIDPKSIFLMVGQTIRSGRSGNYQYESLGVNLVVRFIEQFLAEYRYILRENEDCLKVLVEILDIFVEAGWPSARQLTYRMEEIFR